MSWSKEQVTLLINEFNHHPCLYAVKTKEYKNKHAKNKALESIAEVLKYSGLSVTVHDIKQKFHGLKITFMVEHRKYENSLKSGAGDDDIYYPTLWYYDIFKYVLEHNIPRKGLDNIEMNSQVSLETDLITFEEFSDDGNIENTPSTSQEKPETPTSSRPTPIVPVPNVMSQNKPVTKKRKKNDSLLESTLEEASGVMKILSNVLGKKESTEEKKSRFHMFGEFVSNKLSQIKREDILDEVEEQIVILLYNGIRESK